MSSETIEEPKVEESTEPEIIEETPESSKTEDQKITKSETKDPTIEDVEAKLKKEKDEAIEKAKVKLKKQKIIEKEKLEKEAKEQAEIELIQEEKLKKEKEKTKNSRFALIDKISKTALENKILINKEELLKMNLEPLNNLYLGMVKHTHQDYKITCTKNCGFVDFANSKDDAIKKKNAHSKICPKKTNYGNWIILGFVLTAISGLGYALYSQNKHAFDKDPEN